MTTEIAFILDRSGSMQSMKQAAIDGFNEFLRDQQAAPGITRLSLVLFDDLIEVPIDSVPVPEITGLSAETFVPRGSTALLDAVGATIDQLGARLAALPEADRPGHVVVAILTDGEENCSTRFTWRDISARITHQTEKYQWEFLFLGAGVDAIATATRMHIPASHHAEYCADGIGHGAASKSLSRKVTSSRAIKSGHATDAEIEDAARPLSDIVREEDSNRRK